MHAYRMYNKNNNMTGGSSGNAGKKSNRDADKAMPPSARPTINIAAAQALRPTYAAVAAGPSLYSPSLSTSRTSQASELTCDSSFHTSTTRSPVTPVETPQSASVAAKPFGEGSLGQLAAPLVKSKFTAPPEAVQVPVVNLPKAPAGPKPKPKVAFQEEDDVRMSGGSPPKSPANLALHFGSFPLNAIDVSNDGMLTNEREQSVGVNITPTASSKPASTAYHNVGGDTDVQTQSIPQAHLELSRDMFEQRDSRNMSTTAPSHPMPGHFGVTTPSQAVSNIGATDEDTSSVITNPYRLARSLLRSVPDASPDNASVYSEISDPFTFRSPHTPDAKLEVIREGDHEQSFRSQIRKYEPPVTEVIGDALRTVLAINPPTYTLKIGARVVCIKTDFVANIHASVRTGVWSANEKVGHRINRLWDARSNDEEAVILMFSVNGQKSYCGLGQLLGPWKQEQVQSDWKSSDDGLAPSGQFPVTWDYVKNVSYEHFRDIRYPGNNQPIVNMWNGMHFPYDQGRQVVKTFVSNVHFTNVLAYREDRPYNPYKEITHGAQLDPRLRDRSTRPLLTQTAFNSPTAQGAVSRRGRRAARSAAGATELPHQTQANDDVFSTPSKQSAAKVTHSAHYTTPPTFEAASSPARRPGQLLQCIVDEHGNYVPVGPALPPTPTLPATTSKTSLVPSKPHIPAAKVTFALPPPQFQAAPSAHVGPPQPHFQAYSAMNPPHQVSLQTMPLGGGQGAGPYVAQGEYNVGHSMRPAQPYNSVGYPRMQQPGASPSPLRHSQSIGNVRGGYIQSPSARFGPPNPPQFPTQQRANMPGNLRPMQSMINLGSGPQHPTKKGKGAHVLHAAAPKSNIFVPFAGPNGPTASNRTQAAAMPEQSVAASTPANRKQVGREEDALKTRIALLEGRLREIERRGVEEISGPAGGVSAWVREQGAYSGVMVAASASGSSRRPASSAEVAPLGDELSLLSEEDFSDDEVGGVALE